MEAARTRTTLGKITQMFTHSRSSDPTAIEGSSAENSLHAPNIHKHYGMA